MLFQREFVDVSEDLPHKSGIKTNSRKEGEWRKQSEDLPHKSGIKT